MTHWRGDRVRDEDGFFIYLRDVDRGHVWSAGRRPTLARPSRYAAQWSPGLATITREDHDIESRLRVVVPPGPTLEVRSLTLRNLGGEPRTLELTTFAEPVLLPAPAHAAHPGFSKLFLQTRFDRSTGALFVHRRPRGTGERYPELFLAFAGARATEHETDRTRVLGRGGSTAFPAAVRRRLALGGSEGNVLDPALTLRTQVTLPPHGSVDLGIVLGVADDSAQANEWLAGLRSPGAIEAAIGEAVGDEESRLRSSGLRAEEAEALQAIAAAIAYRDPELRRMPEPPRALPDGPRPIPGAYVLLDARERREEGALSSLARARAYWAALGLEIEAVVLAGEDAPELPISAREAGVRVLHAEELPHAEIFTLFASAAHLWRDPVPPPRSLGDAARKEEEPGMPAAEFPTLRPDRPNDPLRYFNGNGGFSQDGLEYVIDMDGGPDGALRLPPRPWTNVIAGERFGFLVSETGAASTWSRNSREYRLTPWSNDPVLDPHGEAFYLRDEESGAWWSPLPGPAPRGTRYRTRHGMGYSTFEHETDGLATSTDLFLPDERPVRVARVAVTNRGDRVRRLSLFAWSRLVLGGIPEETAGFLITSRDGPLVFARNPLSGEFAGAAVFAAAGADDPQATVRTDADGAAFLGPAGAPARPRLVASGGNAGGRAGAGLDPCFTHQVTMDVPAGATREAVFLLGDADDEEEARRIAAELTRPGAAEDALRRTRQRWRDLCGRVRVETPSPELDLMLNGWLLYQTLSCRIWGRTAFYQSGGAFGFRDQLQDASALAHYRPELLRAQILLHAGHQFVEGDVLHWWHPPLSRGIRTRFADDLLWLPYLTAFYIETTGDRAVLDETIGFLEAPGLADGEDERFLTPRASGGTADLYEHCCRAIDRSLAVGAHGLPLFGCGDWNDGMNRVGREGRGESVWMGFFLVAVLDGMLPHCARRGDDGRAARYAGHRERLAVALNQAGWDGEWYMRGYYDDGAPLGSARSDECRIDALVQAWAAMTGAAPPERARAAMDAAERQLVDEHDGIIRLLTPPFADTPHDPGYIKGYVPGVRENGGQYTHAALWFVRALAVLGRRDRAARFLAMLSPVHHTRTPEDVSRYQVEPYVVAADVYGAEPHVGRGGWTWYTGSAGWMIRVALESILGVRVHEGRELRVRPCIPDEWPGFTVHYTVPGGASVYRIRVDAAGDRVTSVVVDGASIAPADGEARIPIRDDGGVHDVAITLGPGSGAGA